MIELLNHGYIRVAEPEDENVWGSDENIIRAARMSTSGSFRGWDTDARLLRYLWIHKHHTPFEMAGATLEVQAPLFVFREWHRHRTQSYNELSGRYTELPDLYYIPSVERLMAAKQSTKNKQGSEEGFDQLTAEAIRSDLKAAYSFVREEYEDMLNMGVSREVARMVLPVSQYSRMRASANLRNWLGFLTLRMAENAQWEIRQYAEALHKLLAAKFPRTLALFDEGRAAAG